MEALKTIGIKKAFLFVWFTFYTGLLRICIFPQIRVVLMRLMGATIGSDTIIHLVSFSNLYHYGFSRLIIGNTCFLGDEVQLDCRGYITLENNVTLSNRTTVVSHINVGYPDHPLQKLYPTTEEHVIFKSGCYIGTGAIILPGVVIGKESVVGAGSVVTKSVPEKTLVAGVPAEIKKKLVITK
jgi:acetyltransferase-like isoleucine patch superfamily enzyme